MTENPHRANLLLATLSSDDFERLVPDLTLGALGHGAPVFYAGQPSGHVWFPHEGVVSIVALDEHGQAVEVATVGREGMTGIAAALGSETMANDAMVQVAGRGSRMDTAAFRKAMDARPALKALMLRYVLAVFTQSSQNIACNQLHPINTRCARWLLTTHDRVTGDAFVLTQEYLAMMLGVSRPSVSVAAGALQRQGLISYSRGKITILDRPGLEAAACECYGVIASEFNRLRTGR
jgi:CRP-like cAMP-binding protein